jgi:hypothetical protein
MAYTISELNWALYRAFNEDYDVDDDFDPAEDEFGGDSSEWDELENKLDGYPRSDAERVHELEGIGTVRLLEHHGGEGEGDDYYMVISVTDEMGDARLFRRNGWYASYDGGYYEGPTVEVRAVDRLVTFYDEIRG